MFEVVYFQHVESQLVFFLLSGTLQWLTSMGMGRLSGGWRTWSSGVARIFIQGNTFHNHGDHSGCGCHVFIHQPWSFSTPPRWWLTLLPRKPPHLDLDQHHADDVVDIDGYHENHDQHDADEEHHREVEEFLHTHPAISEAQVSKQELALTYSLKDISIAKAAKNTLKTVV